jgi:hypothetical protein
MRQHLLSVTDTVGSANYLLNHGNNTLIYFPISEITYDNSESNFVSKHFANEHLARKWKTMQVIHSFENKIRDASLVETGYNSSFKCRHLDELAKSHHTTS